MTCADHRHTGISRHAPAALVLLGLTWPLATAQESPQTRIENEVVSLVQELGAERRAERVRAEERLLELGPAVLPHLPPPDLIKDAAARDALRRIRGRLERQAAEESAEPSHVTLRGEFSLADLVRRIETQTGNTIGVQELPDDVQQRIVAADYRQVPFWDCITDLAKRQGLRLVVQDGTPPVLLQAGTPEDSAPLAVSSSGAFRVAAESVSRKGSILQVQLSVLAEPRLRPLFLTVADADLTARVGDHALTPYSPSARRELPMSGRGPAALSAVFSAPSELPESVMFSLRGNFSVKVAAAPTELRFPRLTDAAPLARRRGGVTVTLQRSRFLTTGDGDHRARLRLVVAYDTGGPAFESHRTWLYHNEVFLVARDGTRLPVNDGFETTAQADGAAVIEYRFKGLPSGNAAEFELVYVAPTLLIDVPVEFDLRDISIDPRSR
jgi:hypothetical protein